MEATGETLHLTTVQKEVDYHIAEKWKPETLDDSLPEFK